MLWVISMIHCLLSMLERFVCYPNLDFGLDLEIINTNGCIVIQKVNDFLKLNSTLVSLHLVLLELAPRPNL